MHTMRYKKHMARRAKDDQKQRRNENRKQFYLNSKKLRQSMIDLLRSQEIVFPAMTPREHGLSTVFDNLGWFLASHSKHLEHLKSAFIDFDEKFKTDLKAFYFILNEAAQTSNVTSELLAFICFLFKYNQKIKSIDAPIQTLLFILRKTYCIKISIATIAAMYNFSMLTNLESSPAAYYGFYTFMLSKHPKIANLNIDSCVIFEKFDRLAIYQSLFSSLHFLQKDYQLFHRKIDPKV